MSAHHPPGPVLPLEHEAALHQAVMPAGVVVSTCDPAQHDPDIGVETSVCETHSPATRLVPELLCLIFSQPDLSFADRILTSHVCRAWRDASLAFPATLWARIPHTTRLDILAPLLDRTALLGLPVDLMGVSLNRDSRVHAICDVLGRHMWHIRTLGLIILDCSPIQRNDITSAQEVPAPMLRRFFWEERNSWGPVPCPKTFFGGHAPQLECLELSRDTVAYTSSFLGLQSIRRILIRGMLYIRPHDTKWSDIVTFPRLTNLEFGIGPPGLFPAAGGGYLLPPEIPLPRRLTRLGLRVRGAGQLPVLDMNIISGIPLVCIAPEASRRLAEDLVSPFISHVSPHPCEMEAILSGGVSADSVSFRIINREHTPMRTRAFLNVASAAIVRPSLWEATFGIVTSLTLYLSTDFPKLAAVAICPNVEHLTVVWEEHPDVEFPDIGLTFPNLRTLTLALVPISSHRLADPDEGTTFISSLGYEAPKLETLCFRGTTVAAPPEAFYRVAEEVRHDRDGLVSFPDLWEGV